MAGSDCLRRDSVDASDASPTDNINDWKKEQGRIIIFDLLNIPINEERSRIILLIGRRNRLVLLFLIR